ncbi:hypothetical protein SAY87_023780 [Trapa incisa]|uniref:Pectinesterase inhibitor domain-containing protein n=2 Tax=Trapa TaxID=22665 RepID=A0AAN7QG51_TRANT|nr:hypothetical protein SAY86_014687 [Trapa natans]KAK4775819.1 hypothetical protein SAY87_023780 [Trapa incisa]
MKISLNILLSLIFLFPLPLLSPLLPSSSTPNDNAIVSLIDQTCKRTPYEDLCISSLTSNPNRSRAAGVKELAGMVLDSVLLNATDTLAFTRLLIDRTIDPEVERPLDYCAELYIPVVKFTVPQGRDAFYRGQYKFAEYCLTDAARQADACEKMLPGSAVSPMGDRNRIFQQLCSVAVAIIDILSKDQ